jgi:hypothetical protein
MAATGGRRMSYVDEHGELVKPHLKHDERRVIMVAHDECCFHANDRASSIWIREDEQVLKQKSRGAVIHVSDFICADSPTGRISMNTDEKESDARVIIEPGKNRDGWWDMTQLQAQVS